MTDEELGIAILENSTSLLGANGHTFPAHIGKAARALLTKPVATREAVPTEQDMTEWYLQLPDWDRGRPFVELLSLALTHFAPPAAELPPCMDWTVRKWTDWLIAQYKIPYGESGRELYSLLHPHPAPAEDPDREAQALAWKYYTRLYDFPNQARYKTAEENWDRYSEAERNGWRAVAAAEADDAS